MTLFAGIENGIYASVVLAALVVLFRLLRPKLVTLRSTGNGFYEESSDEFVIDEDILIVRFTESVEYPNSAYVGNKILAAAEKLTAYGGVDRKPGDRLWFDDTEERVKKRKDVPTTHLRAVIFDFASVNVFDQGGYHIFIETRDELSRYAGRPVPFYFVNVKQPIQRKIVNLLQTPYSEDVLPLIQGALPDSELYQSVQHEHLFFATIQTAVDFANSAAPVTSKEKD